MFEPYPVARYGAKGREGYLACGSKDKKITIWKLDGDHGLVAVMTEEPEDHGKVLSMALSPGGCRLIAGSGDGFIVL